MLQSCSLLDFIFWFLTIQGTSKNKNWFGLPCCEPIRRDGGNYRLVGWVFFKGFGLYSAGYVDNNLRVQVLVDNTLVESHRVCLI